MIKMITSKKKWLTENQIFFYIDFNYVENLLLWSWLLLKPVPTLWTSHSDFQSLHVRRKVVMMTLKVWFDINLKRYESRKTSTYSEF